MSEPIQPYSKLMPCIICKMEVVHDCVVVEPAEGPVSIVMKGRAHGIPRCSPGQASKSICPSGIRRPG